MGWRDELRPASFRGVEFHVETVEGRFGRRAVIHRYPFRDTPFSEDLGRQAREFSVTAYLIGDDYLIKKRELIRAIEEVSGQGELRLPSDLPINATPLDCSYQWTKLDGGIERFTLVFAEAGENTAPNSIISRDRTVDYRETLLEAVTADQPLLGTGSPTSTSLPSSEKVPDHVIDILRQQIEEMADFIREKLNLSSVAGDSEFFQNLGKIKALAQSTENNYLEIISSAFSLVDDLGDVTRLFGFGSTPLFSSIAENIPANAIQNHNSTLFAATVRTKAYFRSGEIAVEKARNEEVSREELLTERDRIIEAIGNEEVVTGDAGLDDLHEELINYRSDFVSLVNQESLKLKSSQLVGTSDPQPALIYAYNYHDDSEKDSEIVTRNKVRHPLFCPANSELEVLL